MDAHSFALVLLSSEGTFGDRLPFSIAAEKRCFGSLMRLLENDSDQY